MSQHLLVSAFNKLLLWNKHTTSRANTPGHTDGGPALPAARGRACLEGGGGSRGIECLFSERLTGRSTIAGVSLDPTSRHLKLLIYCANSWKCGPGILAMRAGWGVEWPALVGGAPDWMVGVDLLWNHTAIQRHVGDADHRQYTGWCFILIHFIYHI